MKASVSRRVVVAPVLGAVCLTAPSASARQPRARQAVRERQEHRKSLWMLLGVVLPMAGGVVADMDSSGGSGINGTYSISSARAGPTKPRFGVQPDGSLRRETKP